VLLRLPNGCNQEQFEGSRHRGRSGWKVIVARTDDALTVERPDGIPCRQDRCKGSDFYDLETLQNLLEEQL
jgi:hypothetical protein